mmetsp:Transcript_17146/g.15033  ORF Transcript_17146/g.15033 Transcript_17146/m.15033 type:complete len:256 (-) Transcript_17146:567-1334(-)|eukprot:CAMPEP_0114583752 /NCGR_PEP_ID=MMETSP0125-20121206/7451_1 /TAXON_ID=485358 ORGANISM="Aristerostoma sp., Strain ATCC 50986" /NCGR_SAMPLE_ID=MMETSP0125 /ASSEMBLY_ACC=CAM_ASM_000245 /LENGTH=255 /DNA_ID=CAMNT_0001777455 /DNA_START=1538 /DNA_END=2305 /DNA_ORIENTATION=+
MIKDKKRLSDDFRSKVLADIFEVEIDHFTCAYVDKIDVLGKIFITQKRIGFHSVFNSRTLFGESIISIPLADIQDMKKAKNIIGIANTIIFETKKGTVEFTSFLSRDEAYNLIHNLLLLVNPSYAESHKEAPPEGLEGLDDDNEEDEKLDEAGGASRAQKMKRALDKKFKTRTKAVMSQLRKPLNFYDKVSYKYTYNIDYNTFLKAIFGSKPIEYQGKSYGSFWEAYAKKQGNFNLNTQPWDTFPEKPSSKKNLL